MDELIVPDLLRQPFVAQQHVITGSIKALERQDSLLLCGATGTGKTLMAQCIIQGHAQRAGIGAYRALVFAPPHLTQKWAREIQMTVRNAHIHHITSYRDLTKLKRNIPAFGRGWWIVSNNNAKMGPKWIPAYYKGRYPAINRAKVDSEHDSTLGHFGQPYCPVCRWPILKKSKSGEEALPPSHEEMCKKKFTCNNCEEQLWAYTHAIDKWPVATYIHKHMRNYFDYLVLDEAHEAKGDDTAIAGALGSLAAACPKRIAMTATICGGYAWHLRTLLYRLSPASLVTEGLTWKDSMGFSERYGRIEKRVTETDDRGGSDNRQSRGKTSTRTVKYVRPGVMPTFFGRHLIGNAVFLSLDEISENLPDLSQDPIPCQMDAELEAHYKVVERLLKEACREAMKRRDKSLLSKMLQTLLAYPDMPYGWSEIGYHTDSGRWISVVTPENLSPDVIRPKEQRLIDNVLAERDAGRKVWVYSVMTNVRDVNERLRLILEKAGLRVKVLRSSVETKVREQWIMDNAPGVDVMVSHPELVETGLDFFDHAGTYNFPTIDFYSTGYETNMVRQSGGRHFRIGQKKDCKTRYYYYEETMQARAMKHMGEKFSAATSLEGKFSSEGLMALAGEGSGSMEHVLARSLVDQMDDCDVGRAWSKITEKTYSPPPPLVSPASAVPEKKPAPAKPKAEFNRFGTGKVVRRQASFF